MKILGKTLAFLFVVILVIALPLSILVYDAGRVIFDQPHVKEILMDVTSESDLIPAALAWLSEQRAEQAVSADETLSQADQPDLMTLFTYVEFEDWATIRQEVVADDTLHQWIAITVDGFYNWLDSEERLPNIVLDFQPLIERANSEHGLKAIEIAYAALPACTEDQIADFKTRLAAAQGDKIVYNICRLPDPWDSDQIASYFASLGDIIQNIPPSFDIAEELLRGEETQAVGSQMIKTQLQTIRSLMRLAPMVPVVLLLLVLALGVRSLKELGQWWGIPLVIGGALLLLLSLMYRTLLIGALTVGPMSDVPTLVREEAFSTILSLVAEAFQPPDSAGDRCIVLGLILIVVGAAMKPRPTPAPVPVAE